MTAATIDGTVIFSDVVGCIKCNGARGDAAAADVPDRHRALMDTELADVAEGRVVKELCDGLLVWSPSATGGVRVVIEFSFRLLDSRANDEFLLACGSGYTMARFAGAATTWSARPSTSPHES